MVDWSKYVGIPWKFNGSDQNGCDCTGLLRYIHQDLGWGATFDDGKPVEKNWFEKEPYRLLRYLLNNFNKITNIDDLEEGDVLYFKINDEGHTGIYLRYGKFLHIHPSIMPEVIQSLSYVEKIERIKKQFVCGFRRKNKE